VGRDSKNSRHIQPPSDKAHKKGFKLFLTRETLSVFPQTKKAGEEFSSKPALLGPATKMLRKNGKIVWRKNQRKIPYSKQQIKNKFQ
jgi:hypothetical protein